MEQPPNNSPLIVLPDGHAVTEDGFVFKNHDRIEKLNLQLTSRVDAAILSWQVGRIIRRDFNYISTKIVCRKRDRNGSREIRSMIVDLRVLAEEFSNAAGQFEPNPQPAGFVLPVRLVSAEAAAVFTSLRIADEAYHRVNQAYEKNAISVGEKNGFSADFELAIGGLKQYLSNAAGRKTAHELGAEQGIV